MSRLYKLTDTARDQFLVLVGDTEDATDAQTKWETWRDANLDSPEVRQVHSVHLRSSTLAEDFPSRPWPELIE